MTSRIAKPSLVFASRITGIALLVEAIWLGGDSLLLGLGAYVMGEFDNAPVNLGRLWLLMVLGVLFAALVGVAGIRLLGAGTDRRPVAPITLLAVGLGNVGIAVLSILQLWSSGGSDAAFLVFVLVTTMSIGVTCTLLLKRAGRHEDAPA